MGARGEPGGIRYLGVGQEEAERGVQFAHAWLTAYGWEIQEMKFWEAVFRGGKWI